MEIQPHQHGGKSVHFFLSNRFILTIFILVTLSPAVWSNEIIPRDKEALNYQPSLELQKKFPYFLSGYDEEGSPVWVYEFGKWDVKAAVDETNSIRDDLANYTRQMMERFASPHLYNSSAPTWIGIADMDGYNNRQLSSLLAVQQFFIGIQQFVGVLGKYKNNKKSIIVNGNFVFQTLWNLSKPYLGQFADSVEVHGTNPEKWKPALRTHIPKSQLPEWLGGDSNHKVIQIFG